MDDFTAAADPDLNADGPPSLEDDAFDQYAGPHPQVGTLQHWMKVSPSSIVASAPEGGSIEATKALLSLPVDVLGEWVACLLNGLKEGDRLAAGSRVKLIGD